MTLTLAGLALGVGAVEPARADFSDCGDISVEADASCTVVPPTAQCQSMCTPLSVRAACSAQLAVECEAGCDELPSVACNGQCSASCEAECKVDPGKFDCEVACGADCSGRCQASCAASGGSANCQADCMGTCGVSCRKSCDIELPQTDCKGRCEAGCEGSCKVDTNIDCQLDCQAKGYAKCEAEVTGGCKVRCQGEEGALFCEGQYVDNGDNLQQCIDSLRSFRVRVDGDSSGEAGCDDAGCEAAGEARVSSDCSTVRPGARASLWAMFALIGAMLAYVWRVRNPH